MNTENNICLFCGGELEKIRDHLRDSTLHSVMQCKMCGLVQISPLPTVNDEKKYYNNDEMIRRLIPKDEMSFDEVVQKYKPWAVKQAERVEKLVKRNGRFIVEIPNYNCAFRKISMEYDDFCYFRGHICYFTPETIKKVFLRTGFKNIKIYRCPNYSIQNNHERMCYFYD